MNNIPQEFNWVKARAACSVATVFSELFHGVEQDVQEANQNKQEVFVGYPREDFIVRANQVGNVFSVWENGNTRTEIKFFRRDKEHIVVSTHEGNTVITLTIDDAGRCKLRINDEDEALEQWQVRRRLLEPLFFGSAMPSILQMSKDKP